MRTGRLPALRTRRINYFSPEELEEAQEFYEIDREEEPEPTPEEIKAEQEEKARFEEDGH